MVLSGLNATVLVKEEDGHQLLINFDPQVHELIKEATYIKKMNLEIPANAVDLIVIEPKLDARICRFVTYIYCF